MPILLLVTKHHECSIIDIEDIIDIEANIDNHNNIKNGTDYSQMGLMKNYSGIRLQSIQQKDANWPTKKRIHVILIKIDWTYKFEKGERNPGEGQSCQQNGTNWRSKRRKTESNQDILKKKQCEEEEECNWLNNWSPHLNTGLHRKTIKQKSNTNMKRRSSRRWGKPGDSRWPRCCFLLFVLFSSPLTVNLRKGLTALRDCDWVNLTYTMDTG